jgi:hypothetical protein
MSFLIISELQSEDTWRVGSLLIRKDEVQEKDISQEVLNNVCRKMLESAMAVMTTEAMKQGAARIDELLARQDVLNRNVHVIGGLIEESIASWTEDILGTDYDKVFELSSGNNNLADNFKMRLIVIANPHSTNPLDYPAYYNQTVSVKH